MAEFLDEITDDNQDDNDNVTDIADTEELQQQPEADTPEEPQEDDVPEKYRGKSAKEIAQMHMEAEKALGRQGSEVGELRRLVDDFIRNQSVAQQQQNKAPEDVIDEVDFFADPQKAIAKAIETHPKIKQAEQYNAQMRKSSSLAALQVKHPDFQQVVANPDFVQWVQASKVRQELYLRADAGFDVAAADELLSTFKERQNMVQQTKTIANSERKQSVKTASMGTSKGSAEPTSKKTYRRADIVNLMVRDPERYAQLADEIALAYAEKRVR